MSQSLAKIYVHIVFSTKRRYAFLADASIRSEMFRYLGGTCKASNCPVIAIGGAADHVHVLCVLSKNVAASELIQSIKQSSSKWVKTKNAMLRKFSWQNGYGVFSVSQSQVETVRRYVSNQETHHRKNTFQDEFRSLLNKYNVAFDEKYVWD